MSETKKDQLQGSVAQIINARELAINIGKNHGVKKGMIFAILAPTILEIHDPESGELLDTMDREKVKVKADEVRPKITICKTYHKKYTSGGAFYLGLMDPPREVVETLKADDESYPEPLSEEESYVKIGDRVVLVKG